MPILFMIFAFALAIAAASFFGVKAEKDTADSAVPEAFLLKENAQTLIF